MLFPYRPNTILLNFKFILIPLSIVKNSYYSVLPLSYPAKKQNQITARLGLGIPSRKPTKMSPEPIFKARKLCLLIIGVLESIKNFVIYLNLLPVVSTLIGQKIHCSATATLCISHPEKPRIIQQKKEKLRFRFLSKYTKKKKKKKKREQCWSVEKHSSRESVSFKY